MQWLNLNNCSNGSKEAQQEDESCIESYTLRRVQSPLDSTADLFKCELTSRKQASALVKSLPIIPVMISLFLESLLTISEMESML